MNLACPSNKVISITWANFGRRKPDAELCPFGMSHGNDTNCVAHQNFYTRRAKQTCDGRNTCQFGRPEDNPGDPCYGTYKYMEAEYDCVGKNLKL